MRVLFIGFNYHEYTLSICDEFVKMGFETVFCDIQPSTFRYKIARRASKWLYDLMMKRYHGSILDLYPDDHFDKVVFLQVHQFDASLLRELRRRQRKAIFTLYNWDSLATHDYRPYITMFDRVLTFDQKDAEELGIEYLPLFAMRKYQILINEIPRDNAVYFVGNIVNPQRYKAIMAFRAYCAKEKIDFKFYLSTTVHGLTKMLVAGIVPRRVKFKPVAEDLLIKLVSESTAVFDFANHQQTGFTMRVMENLCAGRRVITNNAYIKEAEFYDADRFFLYKGFDFSGVAEFVRGSSGLEDADLSSYSVQNFAAKLIGAAK